MVPSEAGEVLTGATTVGPIAFGRLTPGEDLSGKLVTEVRGRAEAAASAWGADLLLIDGPPGIGCPATASITNTDLLVAVTEPTVSAAHDLRRLIALARRLTVPVVAVLNKADLAAEGAERVRELLTTEHIELLGEVPFDPALAHVLDDLAACRSRARRDGAGYQAAEVIWGALTERLA
jgi:MinD superfamily P-loop ATPase